MKFCIPSINRSEPIIKDTLRVFGEFNPTIFVNNDEQKVEYEKTGFEVVATNKQGITANRNFILDYYPKFEQIIFLDDDIQSIQVKFGTSLVDADTPRIKEIVETAFSACVKNNIFLWGVYPVANAYFMKHKISTQSFIIGTFCGVINTELRYPEVRLKEDYAFTIEHLKSFGGVLRFDGIAVKARHYTNKGGCVDYRNNETEQESIALLKNLYPEWITDNTKRSNEVLLRKHK
jgi:hypothetical protein